MLLPGTVGTGTVWYSEDRRGTVVRAQVSQGGVSPTKKGGVPFGVVIMGVVSFGKGLSQALIAVRRG